ncbi:NAD(P)/FAD-dependent oxidoreductase [Streptomyces sp. WMMC1477]|uniref:NAD(P)/FAD-dependent oxidoreductase n=1 Tax=Streptomyces sp. WMMC1477 TaxID=3015155 RepID=UPI0022B70761|nr:FAD-dependent oxidoreductase [Streptomyces sp. WMMC1477]MCZ7432226.1 FAD-dependent oxidoreductase [Streptomyces sp. WMMC1477]
MTSPHEQRKQRILVLGAGYAGLMASLRLAPHHHVTLVSPAAHFSERIRWHERAAGGRETTDHPLTNLIRGTGIDHVAAHATALDPDARHVTVDDGRRLRYDRLVYTLGSRTRPHGTGVYTPEDAAGLRKRLLDGAGSLAVVGGGLTGVEMAAELAESYPGPQVRLITAGHVGTGLSDRGRAHVQAALSALGVQVEEGRRIPSGDDVDADVVVWTAAPSPNTDLAAAAGLALDEKDRIRVDTAQRSVSHPEILAAGDAAAGLRMSCAAALPTGSRAASTVLSEARGREPGALKYRFFVQCVSLGRREGLVQFVHGDDTPRNRVLTGRQAAWAKERIVRSTFSVVKLAARRPNLLGHLPGTN